MRQTALNDKLIAELIAKIEGSDKKDELKQYINEVAERCVGLCRNGESVRVLNEYKFLIENLRKHFGL